VRGGFFSFNPPVAKLETAIEVLLGAESTKLSKKRMCQAIRAFYGRKETDPLATDASIDVKQFVEGIVGARSRILHGTLSTSSIAPFNSSRVIYLKRERIRPIRGVKQKAIF
jgi:hypothetical protein